MRGEFFVELYETTPYMSIHYHTYRTRAIYDLVGMTYVKSCTLVMYLKDKYRNLEGVEDV